MLIVIFLYAECRKLALHTEYHVLNVIMLSVIAPFFQIL